MRRALSLLALVTCLVFAVRGFAAEAKKSGKDSKGGNEVYFTAKGKAYHSKKDCAAIKNSKDVKSGSKADAEKKGLKACSKCCGEAKKDGKGSKKDGKASGPKGNKGKM